MRRGDRVLLRRQQRARLVGRPHVEPALLAFAVGVEAGAERAVGGAHLAHQPVDDAARHVAEAPLAGDPREVRVQAEQRAVVVEHLLEVRDAPFLVDAVPAEASAQLVVDAAVGHPRERVPRHVQRLGIAIDRVRAQAELELGRVRELGRGAEAAVDGIEAALQPRERLPRRGGRQRPAAVTAVGLDARERRGEPGALLGDRVALLAVRGGHPRQQVDEPGQAVAPLRRKVRARRRTARRPGSANIVSGQPPERRVSSACAAW